MAYYDLVKVHHNECDCLFAQNVLDDKCRKRFFDVYDIEDDVTKRIFICNEHIRLMLMQDIRISSFRYCDMKSYIVQRIIEDIIEKHVSLMDNIKDYKRNTNGNDLALNTVHMVLCERPFISKFIPFMDLCRIYMKNGNCTAREKIVQHIEYGIEHCHYKKYKTKYAGIKKMIRKFKHSYRDEESNLLLIDIINEIFNLNSKQI